LRDSHRFPYAKNDDEYPSADEPALSVLAAGLMPSGIARCGLAMTVPVDVLTIC
jgi:hypothetical protein